MYITNKTSIDQFYDANEGFKKGNLSKVSYRPYKNFKEKEVVSKNDEQALLLFIQKCDLAIQDLTLYLDIKENDLEALKMLNFYKKEFNEAKEKYLKMYGPVYICQQTDSFKWNNPLFPWEK